MLHGDVFTATHEGELKRLGADKGADSVHGELDVSRAALCKAGAEGVVKHASVGSVGVGDDLVEKSLSARQGGRHVGKGGEASRGVEGVVQECVILLHLGAGGANNVKNGKTLSERARHTAESGQLHSWQHTWMTASERPIPKDLTQCLVYSPQSAQLADTKGGDDDGEAALDASVAISSIGLDDGGRFETVAGGAETASVRERSGLGSARRGARQSSREGPLPTSAAGDGADTLHATPHSRRTAFSSLALPTHLSTGSRSK